VKITDKDREVFRRLGIRARKQAEKKLGKRYLQALARAQGRHGKLGGRPRRYRVCEADGRTNERHRFWSGRCSLCNKTPEELKIERKDET
jgi:hypothetical protein